LTALGSLVESDVSEICQSTKLNKSGTRLRYYMELRSFVIKSNYSSAYNLN